jgi:hypothetical protein
MVYIPEPHGSNTPIKHYLATVDKKWLYNKLIQYVKEYL